MKRVSFSGSVHPEAASLQQQREMFLQRLVVLQALV
jgi:hypothetical protein